MRYKRFSATALAFVFLLTMLAGCAGVVPDSIRGMFSRSVVTSAPVQVEERANSEIETIPPDNNAAQQDRRAEPIPESGSTAAPERSEIPEPSQIPESTVPLAPSVPTQQPAPIVPVEAIILDVSDITIDRHTERRIRHEVYPANATDKTVYFQSTDDTVATVSNDGRVYATGEGTAEIRCFSASSDIVAACSVTVIVPVTRVTVTTDKNLYKTGETCNYMISVIPEDATDSSVTITISGSGADESDDNTLLCTSSGRTTISAVTSNGVTGSADISIIDLAAFAAEVHRLTNVERENNGLPGLTQNGALSATGAARARECVISFSHTRPDGSSCFTAFTENGVSYIRAAENIAYGQTTPAAVVADWMNSPGHRANILDPDLGTLGVGVELGANGRLYWAQVFTD